MMPRGGCIFWYTKIYLYKYDYVMDFNLIVMLRSTTSSYGRFVINADISLHRGCTRDGSSEKVVGMSAWCIVHVWHTQVNSSVDSIYVIFWFSRYKNLCICILFSKPICSMKEHWWSLTLSWLDEDQRMILTAHELLNMKLKSQTVLW